MSEEVLYFFRRGEARLASETRLNPMAPGYELVVTTDGVTHVEPFTELAALLAREHELLQAWRAMGWQEAQPAPADEPPPEPTDHDWLSRRG